MSTIERALRKMAKDMRHGPHKNLAENAASEIASLNLINGKLLRACQQTEWNLRQRALCREDIVALREAIHIATGEVFES